MIINYFGMNKDKDFAYSIDAIVCFDCYMLMANKISEYVACNNNPVYLSDFKTGDEYTFLKSGDIITTQTKKIDANGDIVQLQSVMIGKQYDPISMQLFFE